LEIYFDVGLCVPLKGQTADTAWRRNNANHFAGKPGIVNIFYHLHH